MIRRLVDSFRSQQRDPVEFCRQCLAKQTELSHLNAFITVTDEMALTQAKESSLRYKSGGSSGGPRLLEGVPIAAKDNFSTKGIRTTCASRMLESYVPPYSATAVQRLLDAGAVLIGKTNMDEFAMGTGSVDSFYGPVKNPWSPEDAAKSKDTKNWLITGGSSGGSGAAVASGVVLGALGSDTGGSSRSPGAFMAVVGYKPSYGLFSRHGLIPLVNSMDAVSLLASTPFDCAMLSKALLTPSQGENLPDDSTLMPYDQSEVMFDDESLKEGKLFEPADISKLRIGIPKEYVTKLTSSEVLDAWQAAADVFAQKSGGAQLVEVSLPHTQYAIAAYSVLCAAEVASNMARYDGLRYGFRPIEMEESKKFSSDELMACGRAEAFGSVVRSRILAGNFFLLRHNYENYVQKAMAIRRLVNDDFEKVFSQVDVLLTPLIPCTPEKSTYAWFTEADNRTRVEEMDVFTQPANLAGVPAISIPIKMPSSNWPRAVQLIAPRGKDRRLLATSEWLYRQFFSETGSNLLPRFSPL